MDTYSTEIMPTSSSSSIAFQTVFVTVGTTEFDLLISSIDTSAFESFLLSCRCSRLIIQIGRGTKEPEYLKKLSGGIRLEVYRFKPSLAADMAAADLIITHAGAGSISEALHLRKTTVVCVNETLMGNHQAELAEALAERHYCLYSVPTQLCDFLRNANFSTLRVYPTSDPEIFVNFLSDALGLNLHDD